MSKVVKAPASEDGEDSGDETSSATSSVKDQETPKEVTPPAPALPKPKPKLDKKDKIKLGAALVPLLNMDFSKFPFALPEPESLTKAVLDKVGKEIDEITKEKFAEPTNEDYKTARNLMGSQGSDGSLASKRREEAGAQVGAPPSAENNV